MARAAEIAEAAARREIVDRWLLSAPALLIIFFAAVGPLLDRAGLFLPDAKGDYGGVKSGRSRSTAGSSVFFQRDIFDDTLTFADAHLSIFWRSVKLSLVTTRADAAVRLPHRLFHRHAAASAAATLAVPDHHPVLDQPADPHLRHAGGDPQRRRRQHAADLARRHRRSRSRSCSPTSRSCSAWSMSICR